MVPDNWPITLSKKDPINYNFKKPREYEKIKEALNDVGYIHVLKGRRRIGKSNTLHTN